MCIVTLFTFSMVPNNELEEAEEPEDIHMLQHLQWTVAQFCIAVLERVVPCLKIKDEQFVTHAIQLLHKTVSLLDKAVVFCSLWPDLHSSASQEAVSINLPVSLIIQLFLFRMSIFTI